VAWAAEISKITVYELKDDAVKQFDAFLASFQKWESSPKRSWNSGEKKEEKKPLPEGIPEGERDLYELLKGKKTSGLEPEVNAQKDQILNSSPALQEWLETVKWRDVYKGARPYPLKKEEVATSGEFAPPEKENEDNPEENPQQFGEPDEEEQTESGEVEIPDEAKKILNLVDGAHVDIAGRPSVPCPNRDGRSVFPGVVCNECDQRVGCPTWSEYDKQ